MRFGVLGPLAVWTAAGEAGAVPETKGPLPLAHLLGPLAGWTAAGEAVAVPETKVRLLLADLLAHAGEPVGVDRLIDDLWGARPPSDPRAALRVKASQLRRAVGRDLVSHTARGY